MATLATLAAVIDVRHNDLGDTLASLNNLDDDAYEELPAQVALDLVEAHGHSAGRARGAWLDRSAA